MYVRISLCLDGMILICWTIYRYLNHGGAYLAVVNHGDPLRRHIESSGECLDKHGEERYR